MNRIRERVTTFYTGLNRNRKIMLIAGLIAAILAITFLILTLTRTEYVEIARGLSPVEAQSMTSKLDELGIAWKDQNDASVILVPANDVSKARMELAVQAESSNFSWSDVFSSESITMTSQTREQMYIQAKAAEVERSIETITAVDNATVILQIPKDSSYFMADDVKSKASVVLDIKKGYTLNEQQVNGIVNLIVAAVKDLTPENVAVIDSTGVQLNNPEDSESFSANSQFDLQVKTQLQLQKDLTVFLEKLYGIGNVEVQPHVTLDFNQQTETQKVFSPPIEGEVNGLVRSATKITENVVNGTGAVGAPGTDSNSGAATSAVEATDNNSSYQKASDTLNYELNEIYREIVKAQGTVSNMSIGVIVNSKALVDGSMTDDHYNELVDLIAMSAGTGKENIRIVVQEFPDPMANYDVYTGTTTSGLLFGIPIWAIVLVALITLAAILGAVIVMRRNRSRKQVAEEEEKMRQQQIKAELEEIGTEAEDKGSPKYHIEKFVDTNPEAATALLRAWLNEE